MPRATSAPDLLVDFGGVLDAARDRGHELDAMLAEGQGGFTDMMKGAMARRGPRD